MNGHSCVSRGPVRPFWFRFLFKSTGRCEVRWASRREKGFGRGKCRDRSRILAEGGPTPFEGVCVPNFTFGKIGLCINCTQLAGGGRSEGWGELFCPRVRSCALQDLPPKLHELQTGPSPSMVPRYPRDSPTQCSCTRDAEDISSSCRLMSPYRSKIRSRDLVIGRGPTRATCSRNFEKTPQPRFVTCRWEI